MSRVETDSTQSRRGYSVVNADAEFINLGVAMDQIEALACAASELLSQVEYGPAGPGTKGGRLLSLICLLEQEAQRTAQHARSLHRELGGCWCGTSKPTGQVEKRVLANKVARRTQRKTAVRR
jgi:hypothetical protein